MKNAFLAILSILFVGQVASAKDVRLEHKNLPARGVAGGKTTTVTVFNDGVVLRQVTQAVPVVRPATVITRLSAYQMDRIERLIDRAEGGATAVVPTGARCIVAPMDTNLYTADNGQVFLKSGHFCTGYRENVRPAAKQLINQLDQLISLRADNLFAVQD